MLTPESAEEIHRLLEARAELPSTEAAVYLNAGTCGPLPRRSVEAMQARLREELSLGRIDPQIHEQTRSRREGLRTALAGYLGATSEEIALTDRTTDGLNIALWGLEWRPGDEVLTTRDEHPALLAPLAVLSRRRGVAVRFVEAPREEPHAVLGAMQRFAGPRTRALAFSHVLWTTGAVLPVAEIGAWARAQGLFTIVDGAQAAGALSFDLPALQVDFYALPGQKWLLGPEGSGALYAAAQAQAMCHPTFSGYKSARAIDESSAYMLPAEGARRYEVGSGLGAVTAGLGESLAWLAEIGKDWITGRIAKLARDVRSELLQTTGVEVLTPASEEASGLVSFRLPGHSDVAVTDRLRLRGFLARSIPAPHGGVRISTGFYNTSEELQRFVEAVAAISTGG